MNDYCTLKSMLDDELAEIVRKGELSTGELDIVDKLTHSIKSLDTIIAMEGGYSCDGYHTGSSYSRKRDSMGRYSRDYRPHYSRDDSHAYMVEQLESMMQDAPTEREREAIRKCLSELR